MAGSTMSQFAALLKSRYLDSSVVEKLMYPENVLLGMLEKKGDTGMVGSAMPIPLITGLGQGIGGTFTTAQTNNSVSRSSKFDTEAGEYYGTVRIGDKVMKASRSNPGAFLENKTLEIDGLYAGMAENLSIYTWGNGGQALGRRLSAATNAIRLWNPQDAANFEYGMVVDASDNDGSDSAHTRRTTSGSPTVSAVNRATGVVTLDAASEIDSFADNDYLFRNGDFFGDTGNVVIKGVQCFVTATDTPMALWGISAATRLTDPQRYAGCRVASQDIAGKTIEERIQILLAQMTGRFKAKAPTAGFMHPEDFQVLSTLMTARGVRPLEDDSTKFGYMKIDVLSPAGRIPIYCDRHCPKGTFFALRMENWWISSMKELIHPQDTDGNNILRVYNSTDLEFRAMSYPILACNAPKNSGRVDLTI